MEINKEEELRMLANGLATTVSNIISDEIATKRNRLKEEDELCKFLYQQSKTLHNLEIELYFLRQKSGLSNFFRRNSIKKKIDVHCRLIIEKLRIYDLAWLMPCHPPISSFRNVCNYYVNYKVPNNYISTYQIQSYLLTIKDLVDTMSYIDLVKGALWTFAQCKELKYE